MKGFKSTSTNPYSYTQDGVWKKGQYTFQAVVLSDSGYAFAFQRSDTTWQTVDLSWQVKDGSYSKIQWTFTLEIDAIAFRLIANTVTGETIVLQPMLEKGTNGSTPIAHEEDLRGMDGDNHEFIFTRNTTGIAPATPLSTQDDDHVPEDWTDNAQGVTSEIPFEFVSMRERKNGVWLDFSPPSLWAKWGEDGLSVNLLVEGHYKSHWEGITKVVEIIGGVDVGGNDVVKVSAVFRKGEENIAATVSQSRGFQWYVNGVHLTSFDNQPFITLDETYGDGFADYVVLSYLVNSIREEERREIINISEGMDGIGEEFIFKANNSDTVPPVLPQTADVGYQNDDYHGDWSDDPVAPTELNQFVWVAKRKKIGGIWEAFGTPSIWTKWVTDGEPGADGDGITSTTIEYAKSSIGTTPPIDGWSTSLPTPTQGWYLWTMTTTTYKVAATTVSYSVSHWAEDGDGITSVTVEYAKDASGSVPPSTEWSTTIPSVTYGWYLWTRTTTTYKVAETTVSYTSSRWAADGSDGSDGHSPYIDPTTGTWWSWNDTNGQYEDTGYSPVGSDGAIPYPAGYYNNTKRYRREEGYAPYVQDGEVLYLLIKDTPNAGIPTSNSEFWKAFNQWEAVFVTSLVAKFAKIGGAVFTGDTSETASAIKGRLISEMGVSGSTNYESYTGDGGSWQPKLMLDFITGKVKFEDAEITGVINAISGAIGGFAISSSRIGVVQSGNNPTTDGMAIYNDFIKFSNSGASVFVGTNVLPATTGTTALMRLKDNSTGWGYKYGAIIDISGADTVDGMNNNVALDIVKGVTRGLRWQIKGMNLTSNYTMGRETELACYLSASGRIVYLPSNPEIGEMKIVTRVNNYNLTVHGNGKTIIWGATNSVAVISFGPSHDLKQMALLFRWDGTYWLTAGW